VALLGGRGSEVTEVLKGFLEEVMSYYSGCVQLVQSKLNFSLSALAGGQTKFTSKTQHRQVNQSTRHSEVLPGW